MLIGTCCCLRQPSCEMHPACTATLGKRVKAGPACAAGPAAAVLQQGPSTAARRTHAAAPPLDPVQPPDTAHKLVQNPGWAAPGGSAHSPMLGWLPSVLHAGLLCFPLGAACIPEQPVTLHCAVRHACCAGLYAPSPHAGIKARGGRTDAHESVNSVVERMLAAETEDSSTSSEQLPSLQPATSPTGQPSRPRSAGGPLLLARQQHPSCSASTLGRLESTCHPVHGFDGDLSVFLCIFSSLSLGVSQADFA